MELSKADAENTFGNVEFEFTTVADGETVEYLFGPYPCCLVFGMKANDVPQQCSAQKDDDEIRIIEIDEGIGGQSSTALTTLKETRQKLLHEEGVCIGMFRVCLVSMVKMLWSFAGRELELADECSVGCATRQEHGYNWYVVVFM